MFRFSVLSQIWKKYILKLNAWDLSLNSPYHMNDKQINISTVTYIGVQNCGKYVSNLIHLGTLSIC